VPVKQGHALHLHGISHQFGSVRAVEDVELAINAGEFVALLGPSGCGKSTLLRIVSGFIRQTAGHVLFDDRPVDNLPPNRRNVGIVFQSYALFPHLTVAENIAYGLEAHRTDKRQITERVAEMLDLVRMKEFARRLPRELSGGQQQRIALARALAVQPKILLLDEPFGALDKDLRLDMQIEIKKLQQLTRVTTVMVTHDQEEALAMADRVAVMSRGRVEQFGTPGEIYDRPANLFVSRFVGTTNLLAGSVTRLSGGEAEVLLDCGPTIRATSADLQPGDRRALVAIRPEQLRLSSAPGEDRIPAAVRVVMPLGPATFYELEATDGTAIKLTQPRDSQPAGPRYDTQVFLIPSDGSCRAFAEPASDQR
jgi:putative spermidine/putrescine transport system ATP-binding protein